MCSMFVETLVPIQKVVVNTDELVADTTFCVWSGPKSNKNLCNTALLFCFDVVVLMWSPRDVSLLIYDGEIRYASVKSFAF